MIQQSITNRNDRAVANWLLMGVAMIIVQIILGGITRLTGSGLSITEWNVVTGTLPPLSETEWSIEFDKYKRTPQFSLLNSDFTLGNFKLIFFWEWFHRFWARLIGVVFIIPFIYFLIKKRFKPYMVKPLMILFLLGALQGAVGWIMVASGLTGDEIYVKPTRLALHFVFAMGLLCYTFWFAQQLIVPQQKLQKSSSVRRLTVISLFVLVLQLVYGALMAGHKAATAAPTWPDINGSLVPSGMFNKYGILSILEDRITIHFIHRSLAYLLLILIIVLSIKIYKQQPGLKLSFKKWWPLVLVIVQVLLGVLTVLTSTKIVPNQWGIFEWMAQIHQLAAMCLLLSLAWLLYMCRQGATN